MASGTATLSWNSTTTASTEEHVDFPFNYRSFVVTNAGSADLWVRADGTAAAVNGDGSRRVPANTSAVMVSGLPPNEPALGAAYTLHVSVISTGAVPYSVDCGPVS